MSTIKELKQILKARGLPVSGNKKDLLNRLGQIGGGLDPATLWIKYDKVLKERLKSDPTYTLDPAELTALPESFKTSGKYKKYLQWMVESYLRTGIVRYEDIRSRAYPALDNYLILFNKKKLTDAEKDINNFCGIVGCKHPKKNFTLSGLEDLLDKYIDELRRLKRIVESKIHVVPIYKDNHVKIYHPKTVEEAIHVGQGTRWCTAAKGNNMFDHYNIDGPMYTLVPVKPLYPGEKYQIHYASGQYMNEKDEYVDSIELIRRFPIIKDLLLPDAVHTDSNTYWKMDHGRVLDKNNNIYTEYADTPNDYFLKMRDFFGKGGAITGYVKNFGGIADRPLLDLGVEINFNASIGPYSDMQHHFLPNRVNDGSIITALKSMPQIKNLYYSSTIDNITYWNLQSLILDSNNKAYFAIADVPIKVVRLFYTTIYQDDRLNIIDLNKMYYMHYRGKTYILTYSTPDPYVGILYDFFNKKSYRSVQDLPDDLQKYLINNIHKIDLADDFPDLMDDIGTLDVN